MDKDYEFDFDENDPRQDDKKLNTLRVSCMLSYMANEYEPAKVERYTERTSWVEANVHPVVIWLMTALGHVWKIINKPMSITVILSCTLGYAISGCMIAPHLLLNRNFFINILLTLLIIFGGLLLFGLYKSIPAVKEYKTELADRRSTYEDDLTHLELSKATIEMLHNQLEEFISEGGLPERYWDWGREIWDYVRTHRADNLKEALELLEEDLYTGRIMHAVQSAQEED